MTMPLAGVTSVRRRCVRCTKPFQRVTVAFGAQQVAEPFIAKLRAAQKQVATTSLTHDGREVCPACFDALAAMGCG